MATECVVLGGKFEFENEGVPGVSCGWQYIAESREKFAPCSAAYQPRPVSVRELVLGRSTMLPLLFFVCLLPFLVTNALLIARLALNTLRARYGPLWPRSKSHFATISQPSTMQRLVSYLLSVANPPDVDRTEDALDDKPAPIAPEVTSPGVKQPLEYLLAFDVEATCVQGTRLEL